MKARVDTTNLFLNAYNDDFDFPEGWILIDITQEELELICSHGKSRKISGQWVKIDPTQEEVDLKIKEEALLDETEAYIKRTKDGVKSYAAISAEFRLAKLNGVLSEESHAFIERTLIPVRNEVLAGQWISAKNELIVIGSTIIGIDLYNRLLAQITNYINENY